MELYAGITGKLLVSCFTYPGPVRDWAAATHSLIQELLKQDANGVDRVRGRDEQQEGNSVLESGRERKLAQPNSQGQLKDTRIMLVIK